VAYERYFEAVDYLQRRLWHELPIVPVERALQARIRQLLAHFGDPHRRYPVVHVGGSAGKGSTATITQSLLQAAGLRTGLYTSPHLQTFIERIKVNERLVAPDAFADTVLGLDPLVRRMHLEVLDGVGFGRPALVEVSFAAGMKHFADEACGAAVVEVGLGGRTDCTNVFDEKAATVITNVDYEHRERLGWSLASRWCRSSRRAAATRAPSCGASGTRCARASAAPTPPAASSTCGRRSARTTACASRSKARTRWRTRRWRSRRRRRWRASPGASCARNRCATGSRGCG